MELTMEQKNELTKTGILSQKGLTGRPWTDPEVQKVAEDYFIKGFYFREGGLKNKPNCLEIGLAKGIIALQGSSYRVQTEDGKHSFFSKHLGAERMFHLLDEEGYWNGQSYDETFKAD